jgi:hypothetical protein
MIKRRHPSSTKNDDKEEMKRRHSSPTKEDD